MNPKSLGRVHVLSGLIKCGLCGSNYIYARKSKVHAATDTRLATTFAERRISFPRTPVTISQSKHLKLKTTF